MRVDKFDGNARASCRLATASASLKSTMAVSGWFSGKELLERIVRQECSERQETVAILLTLD